MKQTKTITILNFVYDSEKELLKHSKEMKRKGFELRGYDSDDYSAEYINTIEN